MGLRDLHADYLIDSSCIPYERKIKLKMRVVITERKLLAVGLGNEQGQKRKLVRLIVLARIIINFLPKYQRNLLCA